MKISPARSSRSIRRALTALAKRHLDLTAVYLFGSQASGKAGPMSDVDVAVLVREGVLKPGRHLPFQLGLASEAMQACGRSDVEVVLLNEATPLLAYEVVSGGDLIYERDHQERIGYEARVLQRYLDLKPFLRTARGYLKQQLRDGTYGG